VRRPFTYLLLILQLVFATLPGDGLVVCVSGEHGAFGLCGHVGCEHPSDALGDHGAPCACNPAEPCERPPAEPCDHCDGVHLSRGALVPWQSTAALDHTRSPARVAADWLALVWQPDGLIARQLELRRARDPRRAPPPPALALEIVRVTELRI
jgi:hypothetical protein